MVELIDVCKEFNNKIVLNNINFTLNENHIYGLFGKMGTGKSTLLKIIVTQLKTTSGTRVSDIENKNITYVETELCLYSELSVIENLKIWAKIHNVKKDELDDIISLFKLEDIKNKLVSDLSTGNKQKVNLACGLMNNSKLIVLDEPIANLDNDMKNILKEFILQKSKNAIVIITSHQFDEILDICTDVIILEEQQIKINNQVDLLTDEQLKYINDNFSIIQ